MNRELEEILKAYDAVQEKPSGREADEASAAFQSLVDDFLNRHSSLSPQTLQRMIDIQYRRWVRAQKKHPSIPPKA